MNKQAHKTKPAKTDILVAEDSPTQAAQLKYLLENNNYNVEVVANGKQALLILSEREPSMVISDIDMPEMDGYELCNKIKSDKRTETIPVILLTRLSDPEEIFSGLSCGADSFISKPYNERYLLSEISNLLSADVPMNGDKVPFSTQIMFNGKKRSIQTEQHKVINLLVNIYEGAVQQNEKLIRTQEELKILNEKLESIIEERTSDLKEEIRLSKEIAEKLRDSEEKHGRMFETMVQGVVYQNADGHIFSANPAAERILGLTLEQMQGRTSMDPRWKSIHDDGSDFPGNKHPSIEALTTGREVHNVVMGIFNPLLDGYTWININAIPLFRSGESKPFQVYTTFEDITERRLAEEKIKSLLYRQEVILSSIPNIIMEVDNNNKYTWANKSGLEFFGNDVVGKSAESFFIGEQDTYKLLQPIFNGTTNELNFESWQRRQDGEERLLAWWWCALRDAHGKITGGLSSAIDITDKKLIEDGLLKFSLGIEKSNDAIFITDKNGVITYVNMAFEKTYGYSGAEILGKTPRIIKSGLLPSESYKYFWNSLLNGEIVSGEVVNKTKDGRLLTIDGSNSPILSPGGEIIGFLGIHRDISARKKAEEELKAARDKAQESDRLKTAFLHNISHEIRTPMNAIVGFATLLGEPGQDSQTLQSHVETIIQSSNHLQEIISDIVDISNIEANLAKIKKTETDINLLLNNLCNQLLPKAREKRITLVYESGLSVTDSKVMIDSTKLKQIILNLLNNALKFTNSGSVTTVCRKTDKFLEFSVSDTGIGIPKEYHERIFDRFYQIHYSESRTYEGTGLGLSISKAYVELLGGRIWLSSEEGNGATFFFTIPFEKPVEKSVPVTVESIETDNLFPGKKNILVAEDIDSNFKLISYFLSSSNTKILRASNGKEALDLALSRKDIDLILMDIKMPKMDGYTATRLIREAGIKIPIIAQTAYVDDREEAMESGCSGFIAKPFDRKKLISAIAEFFQ
jgi:PAS domain S-box-containing protein